jgi:hypothetical protein
VTDRPAYYVDGPHKPVAPPSTPQFRVTHAANDERVATCFFRGNAELVCEALNQWDPDGSKYATMVRDEIDRLWTARGDL